MLEIQKSIIDHCPGSKHATGLYQFIVNNTPEFKNYFELFAGSGCIGEKLYAGSDKGTFSQTDIFPEVIEEINMRYPNRERFYVYKSDYKLVLANIVDFFNDRSSMVYLDPPYIKSSRRSTQNIYKHEWNDQDHIEFLNYVCSGTVNFNCMISHYENEIYNDYLSSWHRKSIQVMTRKGIATETIYMNYDISTLPLHSYDYLGQDFTDRQRIKRKQSTMIDKINNLPFHEKLSMLQHIQNNCNF